MGVAFLGSYLCISILEFKCKTKSPSFKIFKIYVFLYQNLNSDTKTLIPFLEKIYVFLYQNLNFFAFIIYNNFPLGFMYFYIRI